MAVRFQGGFKSGMYHLLSYNYLWMNYPFQRPGGFNTE